MYLVKYFKLLKSNSLLCYEGEVLIREPILADDFIKESKDRWFYLANYARGEILKIISANKNRDYLCFNEDGTFGGSRALSLTK